MGPILANMKYKSDEHIGLSSIQPQDFHLNQADANSGQDNKRLFGLHHEKGDNYIY